MFDQCVMRKNADISVVPVNSISSFGRHSRNRAGFEGPNQCDCVQTRYQPIQGSKLVGKKAAESQKKKSDEYLHSQREDRPHADGDNGRQCGADPIHHGSIDELQHQNLVSEPRRQGEE